VSSSIEGPNVWIADTSAIVHKTPHVAGMMNIREAIKEDATTMGRERVRKL